MKDMRTVSDNECVARILSRKWVNDGIIMHMAFTLRVKETYISVNRPSVSSYFDDVSSFVSSHPDFYSDDMQTGYQRALLNVGDIRTIDVEVGGEPLNVSVEVEPRDTFAKSHAGIFTRHDGVILKCGVPLSAEGMEKNVSSDDILLEVRAQLLDIAKLETCSFVS